MPYATAWAVPQSSIARPRARQATGPSTVKNASTFTPNASMASVAGPGPQRQMIFSRPPGMTAPHRARTPTSATPRKAAPTHQAQQTQQVRRESTVLAVAQQHDAHETSKHLTSSSLLTPHAVTTYDEGVSSRLDEDIVLAPYWHSLRVHGFDHAAIIRPLSQAQLTQLFDLCGIDKVGHQWYLANKYWRSADPSLSQSNPSALEEVLLGTPRQGSGIHQTAAPSANKVTPQRKAAPLSRVPSPSSEESDSDIGAGNGPHMGPRAVLHKKLWRPVGSPVTTATSRHLNVHRRKRRDQSPIAGGSLVGSPQQSSNQVRDDAEMGGLLQPPEDDFIANRTERDDTSAPTAAAGASSADNTKHTGAAYPYQHPIHAPRTTGMDHWGSPLKDSVPILDASPPSVSLHEGLAYKRLAALLGMNQPPAPSDEPVGDRERVKVHGRHSSRSPPQPASDASFQALVDAASRRVIPTAAPILLTATTPTAALDDAPSRVGGRQLQRPLLRTPFAWLEF